MKCRSIECERVATHEIESPGEGWTGYCPHHVEWVREVLRNTTAGECAVRLLPDDLSLDWPRAEAHLQEAERAYGGFLEGRFALDMFIKPARRRFASGDRTPALFLEMTENKL